jgi:hypothetical protein
MSAEAIELRAPRELVEWKSPSQIKQRIIAIQQLMADVLKPGDKKNEFSGDYGIIPGTGNKPSLWKSGSEQILAMFEIAVEPVVEDLSTDDCFRYRVTTKLTHAPSGNFLGAGIGEASSDETKYKWRRTYSQKEFDATDPDRRRIKYSQYRDSNSMWADKEELQVRQEAADVANTVLKMAKKRSQIDGTLTVTGASSMFSQDLEDLTDEDSDDPKPERKAAKPQTSVKCSECNAEGGHLPSCSKRKQPEAAKPAEVKKASEVQAPAAKPASKQDGPTICSECRIADGHAPDCKYAPKPDLKLYKIVSVAQKAKKQTEEQKKKGITGAPYFIIEAMDQVGVVGKLYVWDTKFHDPLVGKKDCTLVCEISSQTTADKKAFFTLEHIHELDGQKFVNDAPVVAMTADEEVESELFGEPA